MRFTTRSFTRAFAAAALALIVTACDIGEGNGIVSLEIIEFDGSTDYEMRADQCEGLVLAAVATFTDGQRHVYTHRVDWSLVSGDGNLNLLQDSNGFTTAAEVFPSTSTTVGNTITVGVSYLDLAATRDITVNDVTIESLSIEPAQVAIITGETQALSLLLTLSDGSIVSNLARATTVELNDETAITDGGINSAGQQQLVSTETTGSAEVTATFCARLDGDTPSANTAKRSLTLTANHYAGSDANLEITESFSSQALIPIDSGTSYRLPTDTTISIAAQLRFPNDIVRPLSAALIDWTATDGDGLCDDTNECPATISTVGAISNLSAGTVTIDGSYDTIDEISLAADQELVLNVREITYQDPAFDLRDESGASIDTSLTPALSLTNNTARVLRFVALLIDDKGTADVGDDENYEVSVNPNLVLNDENDSDVLTVGGTALQGASEGTSSSITVNITESTLPGSTEAGFSNNIPSFTVEVHELAPEDIQIDADGNLRTAETTATLLVGETLQLRSVLPFSGKDPVLQTGASTWSVDTAGSEFATVQNLSSQGLVTGLAAGTATIKAQNTFTTSDGTEYSSEVTITITVSDPAP